MRSEIHSLHLGQAFSFSESSPNCMVDAVGIIDREGNVLVLYKDETGLHGHLSDHTPVFTE